MALSVPQIPTYERNFGHCIVSWKIKNFSLALCDVGTEFCTEEFKVSSLKITSWRLGFRVESDSSNLHIFLKRIGGESDESFRVSWKITILNGKDEVTFASENQAYIHKDSEHKIDVISPLDILKALPAEKSDEVKISFQMIVLMNTSTCIPTPTNPGITSLIDDMKVIAKECYLSDVTVMVNDKSMKAHRAILYPRSERLSLAAGSQTRKIQLYLSDVDALNRIFGYLYSGDLKLILDPPSISIYDYIVYLDIKELKNAYPQEKITLETSVEATSYEFHWTIKDFTSSDELIESEIFKADSMYSEWQLRIYPKGLAEGTELQKKYVYIEALALSSKGPQNVYVDFLAKNNKGLITVGKRTYGKITTGKKLGVYFMRIGGSSMAKSIIDNVLDISFAVYIATGTINSTIIETNPPVPFNLTNFDTYRILTNYLGHLQSSDIYSDITLQIQGQEIKAHRFLLAGRSATLSRMIAGMKNDSATLPIHNIHKHVFRVLLDFLYRAALTDIDMPVLVHLYDVAVHFHVKPLATLCAKHLSDQLTPTNCCHLLMFADERRSAFLKTQALQFISVCRQVVIDSEGWRSLETKNPQLFYDVVYFLGNNAIPEHAVQQQGSQSTGN